MTSEQHPVGHQPDPAASPATPAGLPDRPAPTVYASWWKRVVARLIDQLLYAPAWLVASPISIASSHVGPGADGQTTRQPSELGSLAVIFAILVTIGLWVWNRGIVEGSTGVSIGKRVAGTRTVGVLTGRPIGIGVSLLREVMHILDQPFLLGFLWPLWDSRRQTFADKVAMSVVVMRA